MKIPFLLCIAALASRAIAKSTEGDVSVTINGQKIDPKDDDDVKMKNVNPGQTILVRGRHMQFDIDVPTLSLINFTLTGFPNDRRLVSKPTLIFLSKTPTFQPGALNGLTLSELEVRADEARLIFKSAGGKYKFQISDIATGGALQIEPEFSGTLMLDHVLGPDLFFYRDPNLNKFLFTDGEGTVTKQQDPINYHEMLIGKDSPEATTQMFQSGTESKWSVQPGGRVGMVFGHDALEPGTGSTCTQQCQDENRIHGSVPV
ncbi:hypothetical protein Hypma_008568 [Hypsizygus marmoreus]|uniref:Glycoside hydrolase 131 catalytic N-terminal domain-containing protein n=1 Tax=Hypsizygus marmoreus TaxID=39966 RepID=A0A369JU79_HYPMA|nr:hypothetical protein Hypma_008568 [Hypsizygus marmoreus]